MRIRLDGSPRQYRAIVSPCSECQNHQSNASEGFPPCPRRQWALRREAARSGEAIFPASYLIESGTDDPLKFSNPIYSTENQTVLVWVAAIEDNRPVVTKDGALVAGSILDPSYDTRYMRCRSTPCTVANTWAQLVGLGLLKEWDQVIVNTIKNFQEKFDPTAVGLKDPILIEGVVTKVNHAYSFPMTVPTVDKLPNGI